APVLGEACGRLATEAPTSLPSVEAPPFLARHAGAWRQKPPPSPLSRDQQRKFSPVGGGGPLAVEGVGRRPRPLQADPGSRDVGPACTAGPLPHRGRILRPPARPKREDYPAWPAGRARASFLGSANPLSPGARPWPKNPRRKT